MVHFTFEYPYFFFLLVLVVCIYLCQAPVKKIVFPHIIFFTKKQQLINKQKALYSLIFALLVTALANPISYQQHQQNTKKGRDLVFVLDGSGSMNEHAFSQEHTQTKFEVLQTLTKEFITHRYNDNVGITLFGSFAFNSVPLSYDMHSVAYVLDFLTVGMAGENTAIGDGIWSALDLFNYSNAQHKVIILITDGYQNKAQHSIKEAVAQAKKNGIKIYTIGLGAQQHYDKKLLTKIATATNGRFFQASDEHLLRTIYATLDKLEPSPLPSESYRNKINYFPLPLLAAIVLLLYILTREKTL